MLISFHFTDLSIIVFYDFQRVCRNAILVDRLQCGYKPILNFFTGFPVLHRNPNKAFFKFSNLHFTSPTFLPLLSVFCMKFCISFQMTWSAQCNKIFRCAILRNMISMMDCQCAFMSVKWLTGFPALQFAIWVLTLPTCFFLNIISNSFPVLWIPILLHWHPNSPTFLIVAFKRVNHHKLVSAFSCIVCHRLCSKSTRQV